MSADSTSTAQPRRKAAGDRLWRRLDVGGFGILGAALSQSGLRPAMAAARRRRIEHPHRGLVLKWPKIGLGGGLSSADSTSPARLRSQSGLRFVRIYPAH